METSGPEKSTSSEKVKPVPLELRGLFGSLDGRGFTAPSTRPRNKKRRSMEDDDDPNGRASTVTFLSFMLSAVFPPTTLNAVVFSRFSRSVGAFAKVDIAGCNGPRPRLSSRDT